MDPALDTLLVPFRNGMLSWPDDGRVLFLRARADAGLTGIPGLVCQQSFKPFADELARAGLTVVAEVEPEERFALVLVLPPRQREEARALLARALGHAGPDGMVVAASLNNEGAKSHEADLAAMAPLTGALSKNKGRAYWAGASGVDEGRRAMSALLDMPRPIADGRLLSRPGLFAWDRIDPGSALLARHLPPDLSGAAADLGAGVGYLSAELLARCPGITRLDLYEAEARALDLARVNLADAAVPMGFHWHDVTAGLPGRYDVIVTNPPFHVGRADDVGLGQGFLTAAADALNPGGQIWLVANRHLPYEATLTARFATVRSVADEGGYKIIQAVAGAAPAKGKRR